MIRHRLFWPLVFLGLLLLVNVFYTRDFFAIRIQNGHLYGSLIDIIHFGAPLILVAIGMTLVIATKGIDLSVGSTAAISAAIACVYISKAENQGALGLVLSAIGIALVVSLVLGLWNGVLVSGIGIQPIIATLILMVAGRGVAMLITDGQIITISSPAFKLVGGGYWLTVPFSLFIITLMFIFTVFFTRKTALGLFIESVGTNPVASKLSGIRSGLIVAVVYIFCGLCAGIAGLMLSSNVSSADANNIGLWVELDAILAVVIGGTSLNGGRFYLGGTLVGALIIQTLTTTIYTIGVPPEITLVVKSLVVILVCLIQSPQFREVWTHRRKKQGHPPVSNKEATM